MSLAWRVSQSLSDLARLSIYARHQKGGGVSEKSEEQPYAIANTPVTEMRSPDPARWYVPVTRDAERSVPDARWQVAWSS
jgi:hypothetical protein